MSQRDVPVIVGSLRKGSFTRRAALAAMALAPSELRLEIVEIRALPLYDQDLDEAPPAPWVAFRDRLRRADGILFATPEYNRSVPGVLKNAIDVASRPYGRSVWDGKPAGVMSVSPGAIGGFGANQHLRQSLVFLNMPAMQQPEAYIGLASERFAEDGTVRSDDTRALLSTFTRALAAWIDRFARRD